ncbi:MAG: hypothetical protein BRD55_00905 [Bacteroidetes bacterium SW_9_63_38]|nr:MAG: hypothetical protein BRD55_00905 [Bacteroidetes bacterium SW_9_63_38]
MRLGDGQRFGILEEGAVERAHVLHDGALEPALVHRGPQAAQGLGKGVEPPAALFQQLGEGAERQQLHVLRKHGKQAPHEEASHAVGVVLFFERGDHFGQVFGEGAGNAGRPPRGIQRERVGKDGPQAVPDLGVAQVVQEDAVAVGASLSCLASRTKQPRVQRSMYPWLRSDGSG